MLNGDPRTLDAKHVEYERMCAREFGLPAHMPRLAVDRIRMTANLYMDDPKVGAAQALYDAYGDYGEFWQAMHGVEPR